VLQVTQAAGRRVYSDVEAVREAPPYLPSSAPRATGRQPAESLRELFDQLAAGRSSALATLYDATAAELHGLALWRTGSTEDAADVVQDVFVRVAEQGRKLLRVRNPRAWLLTVTHRVAVDVHRQRARRRAGPLEECPFLAATAADGDRAVDAARASRLLATLPASQRDTIYLHHFADCSFAEIGAILGVPRFTAASRYRNGVAKLRTLMEGAP
jgi:RNA polymerase sigma-70 factor (ECF subfamily)